MIDMQENFNHALGTFSERLDDLSEEDRNKAWGALAMAVNITQACVEMNNIDTMLDGLASIAEDGLSEINKQQGGCDS